MKQVISFRLTILLWIAALSLFCTLLILNLNVVYKAFYRVTDELTGSIVLAEEYVSYLPHN